MHYTADFKLLSPEEAAQVLKVKLDTLSRWRVRGSGPKFVKIGRKIQYRREDIEAFIRANVRSITDSI